MSGDHAIAVSASGRHQRPLLIAFTLTAIFMIVELVTGIVAQSVALMSDALHMGTDVLGLGMALAAVRLAQRPAPSHRTYGTYRLEVLAAIANGFLLFAVGIYILYEAWERLRDPAEPASRTMLVVAVLGLIVNLISFRLLTAGAKDSLNVKAAFFEVLSDLLGSIGVIVAALVVATTGWTYADPIIGALIGLFILPRTWRLMSQAVRILMEATPPTFDLERARTDLSAIPNVVAVHDLHVWTLTSGLDAATCHLIIHPVADLADVLTQARTILEDRYHVIHSTLQVEPVSYAHPEPPV